MSCNCQECLDHVTCSCPDSGTGVAAALNVSYTETSYSPAQSIFGGYDVVLYTNSSAVSQTVLIEVNAYLIASSTAVLTSTFKKSAVALTGTGVLLKENCPLKSDHTHFLPPTVLTAGQNISITLESSHASGTLRWIKGTVYKYDT